MNWRDSIHSEVNKYFVSNPYPGFDEEVSISLRVLKNEEINKIFLRRLINGTNANVEMFKNNEDDIFSYYSCTIKINEKFINYHFIILTENRIYYYNRKEILNYPPTEDNDFVILADFENPEWVLKSVFYQIFPDRFFNGNSENDVADNEYYFDGYPTKKNKWGTIPPEYNEGHCLDFYGGDLEGIMAKIPYFKEMNINALYLNPIFEAKTNHKYDCIDYFNVDPKFGGNKALKELTEELHKNNIKVIIDVSINHTGSQNKWYLKALEDNDSKERSYYYFNEKGNSRKWRGVESLPQLNYNSEDLKKIIYKSDNSLVAYYIKEPFNIDGWRFDVAMDTGKMDRDQFSNDIFRGVRKKVKEIKRDAYIIGEHWKDNISYLIGDQLDGAMNYFASARPLRCFAGETDRYIADSKILPYNSDYKTTTGIDLKNQIIQHYSRIPNQLAFLQFNLLDSHDIHRFHNNKEIFDFELYKGMIILLYMLPGTPSIYYGDEIGINGHIETVEGCRYPMEWDKNKWDNRFVELYKTLSGFKIKESAFQDGSFKIVFADEESIALTRFSDEKIYIGILSKHDKEKEFEIPTFALGVKEGTKINNIFGKIEYVLLDGNIKFRLGETKGVLLEINLK